MIQYIIAAGIGAFLGSQSKKSKKSYAKGGSVGEYRWYEIEYFDENDMPSGQSLTFKNDEDANRHAENFTIRKDLRDFKVTRTDEIADEDYTDSYPIMSWKKMAKGGKTYNTFDEIKEDYDRYDAHDIFTNYVMDRIDLDERRKIRKDWNKDGHREMGWQDYLIKKANEKSSAEGGFIVYGLRNDGTQALNQRAKTKDEAERIAKEMVDDYKKVVDTKIETFKGNYAKGGKTKVKYDYIPKEAIDDLSYTMGKVSKKVNATNVLSGVYVKSASKVKAKTKGSSDLTTKILAMTDGEDKNKIILAKDVKKMQKYVSDKLITAFYLGLPKAYDFKGDYSYSGGLMDYEEDYAKKIVADTLKNIKANKFEMGLKYPQYDFEKLLGKPIIKDIEGKAINWEYSTRTYTYRLWIWKDCVIGQTIGVTDSKDGYSDYTYGEEPTLMGGYKSIQTSKASKLESIAKFMAKDKDGYVKDNNVLYNGMGGADFDALDKNKIKYAKGGVVSDEDRGEAVMVSSEENSVGELQGVDSGTALVDFSDYDRPPSGDKRGYYPISDLRVVEYDWDKDEYYAKGGKTRKKRKK